jgi:hypothetical protein
VRPIVKPGPAAGSPPRTSPKQRAYERAGSVLGPIGAGDPVEVPASVTGSARTRCRCSPSRTSPSGSARSRRYQPPLGPRTDRTFNEAWGEA